MSLFTLLVALVCFGASLLPLFLFSVFNSGSIGLLVVGIIFLIIHLIQRGFLLKNTVIARWVNKLVLPLLIVVVGGSTLFCGSLAAFAHLKTPPPQGDATVVVLGCQIIEDKPSLMLARRLWNAAEYLKLNPEANCVVSGGKAVGKEFSEAEVMKAYLVECGIEPDRIFPEDKARNTLQNLEFAYALAEENDLSMNAVISTDAFHQMRAQMYAKHCGFESTYSIPAITPWGLVPGYVVREFFAVAKAIVIDLH